MMLPRDGFDVFRLAKPPMAGTSWPLSFFDGLSTVVGGKGEKEKEETYFAFATMPVFVK